MADLNLANWLLDLVDADNMPSPPFGVELFCSG